MVLKSFKFIFLIFIVIFTAFFGFIVFQEKFYIQNNVSRAPTPTSSFTDKKNNSLDKEKVADKISQKSENMGSRKVVDKSSDVVVPKTNQKILEPVLTKEVSSKSFEELINSSVIQLYCGNLNSDETIFSDISRGTGIIIDEKGTMITNRHVIYDDNLKKIKSNCFVLKSPFPNTESLKPKIYYSSQVVSYPLLEKFNDAFSSDKYYNDFALLKITSMVKKESNINLLLGFDYATPADYSVLENNGTFNFLPIDWDYQPKNDDFLITLGYGVDASHLANRITSTIGKIIGNININKGAEPEILLIESNATSGFSGGALINPKSKGLIGLVSWITTGDASGKYTAAIFRDFLRIMMIQYLNFDLNLILKN